MQIVTATFTHAVLLAEHLRETDRKEAVRATGLPASFGLKDAVVMSRAAWTGIEGNVIVGMGGVADDPECAGCGIPWFLASDAIYDHPRATVRHARRFLEEHSAGYRRLHGLADFEHTAAHKWLRFLGFQLDTNNPIPTGPRGWPFYYFWRDLWQPEQ